MLFHARFFGADLVTDSELLQRLLTRGDGTIVREVDARFPALKDATIACMRELAERQLTCELVVYLNHRVQAWAGREFDAPPSSVRFVAYAPAG